MNDESLTVDPAKAKPAAPVLSWKRAAALALFVAFGPHLAVSLWAFYFVSCHHCKLTMLQVMPLAPGLIPCVLLKQIVHLPRTSNILGTIITVVVSVLVVIGVTALLRRARRWWIVVFTVNALLFTALAVLTLCLIRT